MGKRKMKKDRTSRSFHHVSLLIGSFARGFGGTGDDQCSRLDGIASSFWLEFLREASLEAAARLTRCLSTSK
jgi:hypothetical protein